MFQDVSSEAVESTIPVAQPHSSLFDDVYNFVSTALHTLKETAEEHPYASATLGLAMGASMFYLTKGKLWGVASETSPFKWTNSIGIEKTISSPKDVALLDALQRASKGRIFVLDHEYPKVVNLDWLSATRNKIDWSKALRVSAPSEKAGLNMFPQSPNTFPTSVEQGLGAAELAARIGKQMADAGKEIRSLNSLG